MNWSQLVWCYLVWQIPLSLSAIGIYLLPHSGPPKLKLWSARALWLSGLVLPPLFALFASSQERGAAGLRFEATAQGSQDIGLRAVSGYIQESYPVSRSAIDVEWNLWDVVGYLIVAVVAFRVVQLIQSERSIRKLYAESKPIHDTPALYIGLSSAIRGPLAMRAKGRRIVLLDEESASDPSMRKIAVMHEIQHHRQRDPQFARFYSWVSAVFAVNPLLYLLTQRYEQLEEEACDVGVLGRKSIAPAVYCEALLSVARRQLDQKHAQMRGAARAMSLERSQLRKRIESIMNDKKTNKGRRTFLASSVSISILTGASWGLVSLGARAATPELDFSKYLGKMSADGLFIPDSPQVREQLKRILSRPKTVKWIRGGIQRYRKNGGYIDQQIAKAGLPAALRAVPLLESGYRPEQTTKPRPPELHLAWTRGLWQFIPSTGRRYGLVVNEKKDERGDVPKSTAAALKLLQDLYREFNSWPLAFAAYNQGSTKVLNAWAKAKSRDVSVLAEKELIGKYSIAMLAFVVIMNHPELVGLEKG